MDIYEKWFFKVERVDGFGFLLSLICGGLEGKIEGFFRR